jgi:hypothetical protein
MTTLFTRIFSNFYSSTPCTTEDSTLKNNFSFLFTQVQIVARHCSIFPAFQFFLVLPETPPCLPLLVKTGRLPDAYRLLTVWTDGDILLKPITYLKQVLC